MKYDLEVEQYARKEVLCIRCGAEPGNYCKTVLGRKAGKRSSRVHTDRFNRAWGIVEIARRAEKERERKLRGYRRR